MNTRGKKIEFAEMLGSSLRLSEKTAAKTAKTSKRRATSLDGTKLDVPLTDRRSGCLVDLDFSRCPKSELSYNREGRDDSSVGFQIEDSGLGDFMAGDPQVIQDDAEENISGLQESRISAPVFKDGLSFADDKILCDKDVQILSENDGHVVKCPDVLPMTTPSQKTVKRGYRQDVQNSKKQAEDFPKDCSPSGNLPDSGSGRSTRRNRPLDYKCLAGLREYGQRKRKSLEDDTANSGSPSKFNASVATRFSKKLCLDSNRVSAYDTHGTAIKLEAGSIESRQQDQAMDANGFFTDPVSHLSSVDARKSSRPFNTIASDPFVSLRAHRASTDGGQPSEVFESKVEIKSVKEEVCRDEFLAGSCVASSRVDLSIRNGCSSGDKQVGYVNVGSGDPKDAISDCEIPALKCREAARRPYDNAQISSLICKIEARMNRLKNSCDLSSSNEASNPLSVRAREKKLNCSTGAKAKEKDYNRETSEETTATAKNWKYSPVLEDKQRKTLSHGEFSGSSSGKSSSFSSGKSNSSTEFQEIGKTRLHARKSLALSLARAANTSEKVPNNEVEKISLRPAHGVNAVENASSGQRDDGKPSLKMKFYKFTNAGVPSEYATASKLGLGTAPAGRSAQQADRTTIARKSVFTSPELDDYLESNSRHPYVKEKEKAATAGPEIDEVEGFTFLAFTSERALEDYMKKLNAERVACGHFEEYDQSQYASDEYMACRAKQLALERAGKIRRFSAGQLSDLGLVIKLKPDYFPYPEPCPDEAASVGKVTRRGIGKMGNEKRQPRKGKIYGRKVTGRFASKANIKYYVKKRSPNSLTQIDKKNNTTGGNTAAPKQTTAVKNETLNLMAEEDLLPVILTMKMAISATRALRVESAADKPCNQEDCTCVGRRGVQPSYEPDQSDADLPALSAECSHEHCHLGCVCDSLCTPQKRKLRSGHCGRPECMFDCRCDAASLLQSPGGGSGGNVEKEPAGPLSFTRNLFRPAEPKESGGESAAPSLNSSVRPTVKRRKRRGWGIPIDEGLNVADDATARTDKDGHLLRKSGRIKERRRFSDIEKMKSLIYFDASLWLREDKGPQRRRRGDRSSRTDSVAPHQLSAPEGNTAQAFPVGSEPATHETCGKMTALKSDPVTWEISDDERPHSLAHHAREGYGRQARSLNSVSASASVRPEDKQRAKLLADKLNSERAYHLVSSDNDDVKDSDDEFVGDDTNLTCARMLTYDRSSKRPMEETSIQNHSSDLCKSNRNPSASGALKSRPGFANMREASQKMSSRKAPDPMQNKFTKSVMLVKKNPTSRDRPEGKKPSSPVILLDIVCNCTWQEYRDPIVGKVYEMVADGQAVAGNSFELQNLLIELMPKSEKELVIPKNIMETTQAADLHVVPIRITKRPDAVRASPVHLGNNAAKISLVPPSEARSSVASESGGIGLSGMKHFVTAGGFPAVSMIGGSGRLATSCTFGPFPSIAVAENVPEAQLSFGDFRDVSAACTDAGVDLSSDLKLPLDATRWCDAAPSSCTKELSAIGTEDAHDDCETQSGVMNLSTRIEPPAGLGNDATGEHLTEAPDTGLDSIRKLPFEDAGSDILEKSEEAISLSLLQTVSSHLEAVLDCSYDAKMDSADLAPSLISSAVSNIDTSICRVSPPIDSMKEPTSMENSCSTSSEPSGQFVLANSFQMSPQVFDSLLPATASAIVAPPVAISSVSICPKIIPVSSVRFVTVGAAAQTSHISSDVVSSSVTRVTPRAGAPVARPAAGMTRGSLLRAPLKPGSFILATSSGGSSGVTLKPTPVQVIPPAMIVTSRASGVAPLSAPRGPVENLAAGKCILVPATKLLRLGVPLEMSGAGKSEYFAQMLKKGVSGCSGPGHSLPGVDFVQVKPVSSFHGKQTVTISTSMIPLHKPVVSVVPPSAALGSTTADGKTSTIHTKVKSSGSDVIEIPDDSDEEKCPDVIDILQAEVDGSNEATILREKLGLPLENSASKHGSAEQSQSTISATQKKKRKQMHEEKTELAMNVEFVESWVAVLPGDVPEEKSVPKEDASSKEPVPMAATPSEEGVAILKPKEKNASSSVFLELYSGLFRAVSQYLVRSGEVKKKLSKLYIIRKAIKVIKRLTERNRIFVNALVTEKLTNDRLRARLNALRAVRSALEMEMPDSSDQLASSEASSSGNQLPSEKRRVSGPLRRKFRGITKKEALDNLTNSRLEENADAWKPDSDPVEPPDVLLSESAEKKTTRADVELLQVKGGDDDIKSAEACGAYATADEPLDSAQDALPEDFVPSVCAPDTEASGVGLVGDGAIEGDCVIDAECQKFVSELVFADVLEEIVDSGSITDQ